LGFRITARFLDRFGKGIRGAPRDALVADITPAHFYLREGPPLRAWRKRGAKAQAIGVSRGGRTTKIHAICDLLGRPVALKLTPGNTSDIRAADDLMDAAIRFRRWSPIAVTTRAGSAPR
jgi:hypothetical protein